MPRNISVRVPWHDNGWNGKVCKDPQHNGACKILKNIASKRQQQNWCEAHRGEGSEVWDNEAVPPCLRESGFFLSPRDHCFMAKHPYVTLSKKYSHLLDTKVDVPPNSFIGIPYGWFLKPRYARLAVHQIHCTGYDEDIELKDFQSSFISNGINQEKLLKQFWRDVVEGESLVVAYAKAVPFSESGKRVIISMSTIQKLGELKEYDYAEKPDGKEKFKAWTWERTITHALSGTNPDGFMIPFHQIEAYVRENPDTTIDDLLLFAPDEYRQEFSYGCEHISPDALIITLNRARELLKTYMELGFRALPGTSWEAQVEWCTKQLDRAWRQRGPFPGLGAVLGALGLPFAYDVAEVLRQKFPGPELWEHLGEVLENKKSLRAFLPDDLKPLVGRTTSGDLENILGMLEDNGDFVKLLARMNLNPSQMDLLLPGSEGKGHGYAMLKRVCPLLGWDEAILAKEVLKNPYILYEQTRLVDPDHVIGLNMVDLALFPPEPYASEWFGEDDRPLEDANDKKRIRALVTQYLEEEAQKGNTFMPQEKVLEFCNTRTTDLPGVRIGDAKIYGRALTRHKDFFAPLFFSSTVTLRSPEGEESRTICKLSRMEEIDVSIRAAVEDHLARKNLTVKEDWDAVLAAMFPAKDTERERKSRAEKKDAVQKMAASPLSVLTGGAGTGKTSALRALCHNRDIQAGRILILTPTGKARVVLSSALQDDGIVHEAKTVFAYLLGQHRCDERSYRYYLSGRAPDKTIPRTVIIDESSMLTEEMMGALLQSLAFADRIIFAGDPNQLPPIGAGKPFFELCRKLEAEEGQPHFSCLQVNNRQEGFGAGLGNLFKAEGCPFANDREVIARIMQEGDETFKVLSCEGVELVEDKVKEAMGEIFDGLGLAGDELIRFDQSLGGTLHGDRMNFNDPGKVERWQILTPWCNRKHHGSKALNAMVHEAYGKQTRRGSSTWKCGTRTPLGRDGICYGEKVICTRNESWNANRPNGTIEPLPGKKLEDCLGLTANGEIGIIGKLYGNKWRTTHHGVRFASQKDYIYKYKSAAGSDESEDILELAYALTIHKAQGSGFDYTILVLMNESERPSPFLSREMIYTALTRQRNKIIIITNRDAAEILEYAKNSELQNRLTNLFGDIFFAEEQSKAWHDERLVHRATDGLRLRSKSELVIYNMLLGAGLSAVYEKALEWEDGKALPDFTLMGRDGPIYWEHLGMLGNEKYAKHWQAKKELYAKHGIREEAGNLIITMDDPLTGGLDTQRIAQLLKGLKQGL
ncbi:MAG: AAA family ATPase [Desulfovibrio sp.]|nr:AAA family ATPase [Desulfovibrio sp.]